MVWILFVVISEDFEGDSTNLMASKLVVDSSEILVFQIVTFIILLVLMLLIVDPRNYLVKHSDVLEADSHAWVAIKVGK